MTPAKPGQYTCLKQLLNLCGGKMQNFDNFEVKCETTVCHCFLDECLLHSEINPVTICLQTFMTH